MQSFAASAGRAFPEGEVQADGTPTQRAAVFDSVQRFVDACGYQAMVDVANQYANPVYSQLIDDAAVALGEITTVEEGLYCYDLADLGFSAANAVDYWFFWGAPPRMDADLDGVPCETIWPNAGDRLPGWY